MNDQHKPGEVVPDYGSTSVWSDDDKKNTDTLIKKYEGDLNGAMKRLFESGGGTDYATARVLSARFAESFKLTEVEFMKLYRKWRRGKLS
jgi:hypothetical protein